MVKLIFDKTKKALVSAVVIPVAVGASAVPVMADTTEPQPQAGIVKTGSTQNSTAEVSGTTDTSAAANAGSSEHAQTPSDTSGSSAASETATSEETQTDEGSKILGECKNYGIICDNFHQHMDAETNVAAKTADAVTYQHTGNDLTKNHNQKYLIGKVTENSSGEKWFGFKGKTDGKTTVVTSDKNGFTLDGGFERPGVVDYDTSKTEEEINQKIDQLKQSAEKRLDIAISKADTFAEIRHGNKSGEDSAKWYLDLTGQKDGIYYVNVTDKDQLKNGQMYINLSTGKQTVILHTTDSLLNEDGSMDFSKYLINGQGCDSYGNGSLNGDNATKSVVWDFRNVTGKLNINGSVTGIFIAPNAYVTNHGQSSGWIICKDMTIDEGEWHNINQDENFAPEDSAVQDNDSDQKPSSDKSDHNNDKGNDSSGSNSDGGKSEDKSDTGDKTDQGRDTHNDDKTTSKDDQPQNDHSSDSGKSDKPSDQTPKDDTGHNDSGTTVTPGGNDSGKIDNGGSGKKDNSGEKPSNTDKQDNTGKTDGSNNTDTADNKGDNSSHSSSSTDSGKTEGSRTNKSTGQKTNNSQKGSQDSRNKKNTRTISTSGTTGNTGTKDLSVKETGNGSSGHNAVQSTQQIAAQSSTVPQTGDHSNLLLYGGIFVAAAAGLALTLALKKKR